MSTFTLGVRTSDGTAAAAAWEIRAVSRVSLKEMGVYLAAATASIYGLGRPQAKGITPTTPVDFLSVDTGTPVVAGAVQSALAWGTGPTVPTAYLRRIGLPATIATGVVWKFDPAIVIPAGGSLVLWNIGTNGVVDAYALVET